MGGRTVAAMDPTVQGARMTDAPEPGDESPGHDRDLLESDPDQAGATHGRLGKVWAVAVLGAWSATAIIALTVGRPELAKVQHIVQQTTGMSALPPLIPGFPPASVPPSSAPPSHDLTNVPMVQNGSVTRRGGLTPGRAAAPGGSGPSAQPSATRSPSSPPARYTQPPASSSAPVTPAPPTTVPTSPPTTTPTTAPPTTTPTPTPDPTADPTVTPTADPTSTPTSPAAASCLSSAADSSSVSSLLGAVASCASDLSVP